MIICFYEYTYHTGIMKYEVFIDNLQLVLMLWLIGVYIIEIVDLSFAVCC